MVPRDFGGASTKKKQENNKKKSFPDSCVLAALLMPLARSSTLCWLLICLASWATFFSAQLQLENAEIWHNETSGDGFFQLSWRVSGSFFEGGGWNLLGWTKPQIWLENLETNWFMEDGMLMITCVLKVVPEFGQFAAGFLGWSDPCCSLGAVIMMQKDVYIVFHVYEYSTYHIYLSTSSAGAACKHENGQDTPRSWVACLQIWAMSLCLSILHSQMFLGGYNATGYFNVSASRDLMHQDLD